jgi:hypothetical protein
MRITISLDETETAILVGIAHVKKCSIQTAIKLLIAEKRRLLHGSPSTGFGSRA